MCGKIDICRCRSGKEVSETCETYSLDTCISDYHLGRHFGAIFERDGNKVTAKEYIKVGGRCETFISQVTYTCGECHARNGFKIKCGFSFSGSFLLIFLILLFCCVCCLCAFFFLFAGITIVVVCFIVAGVGTFAFKHTRSSSPEEVSPAVPADFSDSVEVQNKA